jgi:hypothetical protein
MKKTGEATDSIAVLRSGEAKIACTPTKEMSGEVTREMDAICEGFAILARECPANVTYERMG